jgi:cell division septum initiation protein DivIVA
MWPLLLAIGGALALVSSSSSSSQRRGYAQRAPLVPPSRPARPSRHARRAAAVALTTKLPGGAKLTLADVVFACELARIHEPNKKTLARFATLLQKAGYPKQAASLTGAPSTLSASHASPLVVPGASRRSARGAAGASQLTFPTHRGGHHTMVVPGPATRGSQTPTGGPSGLPSPVGSALQGVAHSAQQAASSAVSSLANQAQSAASAIANQAQSAASSVANQAQSAAQSAVNQATGQGGGSSGASPASDPSSDSSSDPSSSTDDSSGGGDDGGGGDASVSGPFSYAYSSPAGTTKNLEGRLYEEDVYQGDAYGPSYRSFDATPPDEYSMSAGQRRREMRKRMSVSGWFDDVFGDVTAQAFPTPPPPNFPPNPPVDGVGGDGPPGWISAGDGNWSDPTDTWTYYWISAWDAYYTQQARNQARVGDALSGLANAAPSAASNLAGNASSLASGGLSSLKSISTMLPKNLPVVGNIQGQIATGMSLLGQIQGGNESGAIEGGIGLAVNAAAGALSNLGSKGKEVATILEGAAAGAAAGASLGPYGAAAGAIIGAVAGFLEDEFGGVSLPPLAVNATQATQAISAAVASWNSGATGGWSLTPDGHVQGWHMAQWCAAAYPPKTMSNYDAKRLARLGHTIVTWGAKYDTQNLFHDGRTKLGGGAASMTILNYLQQQKPDPLTFRSWQLPICSDVFWDWYQPSQMGDFCSVGTGGSIPGRDGAAYINDLTYPGNHNYAPDGTPAALLSAWQQMTTAQGSKTTQQIVKSAVARRPSALWFACDLYGAWLPTAGKLVGANWSTVYFDADLLNAMATVLGMLSVGSSTQAIVSELLLQISILHVSGAVTESPDNVSPGVRELLDDYLYMGHQEYWAKHSNSRSFAQWVAHYLSLTSPAERSAGVAWSLSKGPVAGLRASLETLNS